MTYIQGTLPGPKMARLGGIFGLPSSTQFLRDIISVRSAADLRAALDEKQTDPGFNINAPLRHLHTEIEYDRNDPVKVWRTPIELAVDDWKASKPEMVELLLERGATITRPTLAIALRRVLENSPDGLTA